MSEFSVLMHFVDSQIIDRVSELFVIFSSKSKWQAKEGHLRVPVASTFAAPGTGWHFILELAYLASANSLQQTLDAARRQ